MTERKLTHHKHQKTPEELRKSVLQLEAAMNAMADHHVVIEPKHYFAPGIYMREISIPAGTVLTGKIHRTEHMCVVTKGFIRVVTDDGVKDLECGKVIKSMPGAKRCLVAMEDSIWLNVHHNPTNETELEKIEELYVVDTFEQFYLQSDRSFNKAIGSLGFTEAEVKAISENTADYEQTSIDGVTTGPSEIHGTGLFTTKAFKAGETLGKARIANKRTQLGRFCNHSGTPNITMVKLSSGDVEACAIKDIAAGQEILNDYYLSFVNTNLENKEE